MEAVRGVARVERRGPVLEIVVADINPELPEGLESFAAVALTAEGDALLTVHHAPPALLASGSTRRTTPEGGCGNELVRCGSGDRIVLLSAAAYDAMPECLGRALHDTPDGLRALPAGQLLQEVLAEVGAGAGVVIDRDVDPGTPTSP